jgi:hemerythrin
MPSEESSDRPAGGPEFDRWWQRHSELDRLVEALAAAMEGERAEGAERALRELAEALDLHFRVEEESSFPLVERLSPQQAPAIAQARAAHAELRARLDAIAAEIASERVASARAELTRFLEGFRTHEEAESRLIAELRGA